MLLVLSLHTSAFRRSRRPYLEERFSPELGNDKNSIASHMVATRLLRMRLPLFEQDLRIIALSGPIKVYSRRAISTAISSRWTTQSSCRVFLKSSAQRFLTLIFSSLHSFQRMVSHFLDSFLTICIRFQCFYAIAARPAVSTLTVHRPSRLQFLEAEH